MDRLFLETNVLLSAAYETKARLQVLWKLKDAVLCSSPYGVEEARGNLEEEGQKGRSTRLLGSMQPREIIGAVRLPERDVPILLGAIETMATHLISGDLQYFGPYFGKRIEGILIVSPSDYLKRRK